MYRSVGGKRVARFTAMAFVMALVITGAVWWVFAHNGTKQITAFFSEAVGVYPGSDVRILGVPVGEIDSVTPFGRQVEVTMTVDRGVAVPARARALVVAPSVVSDRYIQLSPVYSGGLQMVDGATIPASRTATPAELDQIYASLNQLATALGPSGANKNGALSDLLNTGAANLDGNGQALGTTIAQLGAATRTLSGSQANVFGTVDNLRKFTTLLVNNDGQVRQAEQQLAQVSGFLSDDRDDLGAALNELATALSQVQGFINTNRHALQSNVDKLASVSQVLVNQRASLAEMLDAAPLAVTNVLNAYDPVNRTLDGRGDLNELSFGKPATGSATTAATPLAATLCATSPDASVCQQPLADGLVPVSPSTQHGLPPLPLPAAGPVFGTAAGGGR
ncbi:MAG TPA: MCE family protein [Pseudonocardiaceae bacterium]|nr:MCE family protein [Pseudonocardiaceae bacterium]